MLVDDDRNMEMEEVFHPKKLETQIDMTEGQFKEMLHEILTDGGFHEKRSRMMSTTDFLELLSSFNARGVHFR